MSNNKVEHKPFSCADIRVHPSLWTADVFPVVASLPEKRRPEIRLHAVRRLVAPWNPTKEYWNLRLNEYLIFGGRWWAEEPIANLFIGEFLFFIIVQARRITTREKKTFQFLAIIEIRSVSSYIWVGKTCFIHFLSYINYRTDNCMMSNIKMP